ncbi:hypothetical protein Dimus_023011, partial [Dionaea muscipula]
MEMRAIADLVAVDELVGVGGLRAELGTTWQIWAGKRLGRCGYEFGQAVVRWRMVGRRQRCGSPPPYWWHRSPLSLVFVWLVGTAGDFMIGDGGSGQWTPSFSSFIVVDKEQVKSTISTASRRNKENRGKQRDECKCRSTFLNSESSGLGPTYITYFDPQPFPSSMSTATFDDVAI